MHKPHAFEHKGPRTSIERFKFSGVTMAPINLHNFIAVHRNLHTCLYLLLRWLSAVNAQFTRNCQCKSAIIIHELDWLYSPVSVVNNTTTENISKDTDERHKTICENLVFINYENKSYERIVWSKQTVKIRLKS